MTDEVQVAPEATPEVVQPEAVEAEAAEAPESTEGQEQDPPAEVKADEPEAEEKTASQKRRERRKAHEAQLRERAEKAEAKQKEAEAKLARFEEANNNTPPSEADFQDYNEYLMAAAAWQAGQQFDQRQRSEVQREADTARAEIEEVQRQRQAAARENWVAQTEEARTRYSDFDAVVSAPDVPITQTMAEMIAGLDNAADVAYHLGMNKAEAAQIARMPPIEQAMAIGRLEASISRPTPRTQSQAPSPIAPVKGGADIGDKDPDKMSMPEYIEWRKRGSK